MIQINITNKAVFTLMLILTLLTTGIVVLAYNSGGPPSTFGHSSEELEVTIEGAAYTIQEAIDQDLIASKISIEGANYKVQDAFDQDLLGIKECRVCFKGANSNVNGQCMGDRNSCSEWSKNPGWTQTYTDDTDDSGGGCSMRWQVECR